ncbi:MAG: AAA family ATPase [Cytophaga sp.]|uniref:AAA family ATPase n=1 Tax=Cytophaga sp. TaxID=29535 RepID=UPI003F7E84AE
MNTALILVCGLPGSGKSFFAKHLSKKIQAAYFNSDLLRKELYPTGRTYSEQEKQLVYDTMLAHTSANIEKGKTVVVDATFYKNILRIPFYKLAIQNHIPLYIFYIEANQELIKARTSVARTDSEADYAVYLKLKELFEPIEQPYKTLTSGQHNIDTLLSEALMYISP